MIAFDDRIKSVLSMFNPDFVIFNNLFIKYVKNPRVNVINMLKLQKKINTEQVFAILSAVLAKMLKIIKPRQNLDYGSR